MPVPDFQSCMLPLLQFASQSDEHSTTDAYAALAEFFNLTEEDMNEMLPSGKQQTYKNRIAWANSYLKKARLLQSTRRGYSCITQRGLDILETNPQKININYLNQFPEFEHFREQHKKDNENISEKSLTEEVEETPEEIFQQSYKTLRENLESELLEQVKQVSPYQFEQLVVDLLVKMGYGGNQRNAGQALKRSHDRGIDGVIKEDALGLDIIYIQAKRWDNTVGRPEIQKFAGALQWEGAAKGVFITTSHYSQEAIEYAKGLQSSKIILVDGVQLSSLMVDYNLGVSIKESYEIKKIDFDYFTEE
jgi:restriction system protein